MKPEATAIGDPQNGRWKITLTFIYSMPIFYAYAYAYNCKESMDEGFTYSDLAIVRRSR